VGEKVSLASRLVGLRAWVNRGEEMVQEEALVMEKMEALEASQATLLYFLFHRMLSEEEVMEGQAVVQEV